MYTVYTTNEYIIKIYRFLTLSTPILHASPQSVCRPADPSLYFTGMLGRSLLLLPLALLPSLAFAGEEVSACFSPRPQSVFHTVNFLMDAFSKVVNHRDFCAPTRPGKDIHHVLFLFEGTNGHTDAVADEFRKFQAAQPVCANGNLYYSDGKSETVDAIVQRIHALGDQGIASPVALKNFIFNSLCNRGAIDFATTEVIYIPENVDLDAAQACAENLVQKPYAGAGGKTLYPTLTVMGHSWGAFAALEMAKRVDRDGYRVDLGMTVDPIPKQVKEVASIFSGEWLFHNQKRARLQAPAGVKWVNYWQNADDRIRMTGPTLEGSFSGLRGHGVDGAGTDEIIQPPLDASIIGPNGAHWRIFNSPIVTNAIETNWLTVQAHGTEKTSFRKD
jgi:hypothetical protein